MRFRNGYSSLSYLQKMPLDSLKIDRSFVKDIEVDKDDAAITQAIIAMAKQMNLSVVAEGVETEMQRLFLIEHGCKIAQGYYYAKSMPRAEFEVRAWSNSPAT